MRLAASFAIATCSSASPCGVQHRAGGEGGPARLNGRASHVTPPLSFFLFQTVRCHQRLFEIVRDCAGASDSRSETARYLGGVFTQRGHSARTAPIITVIIQVTTLKTNHLRNHAQSIQNSKIQTSDACHGSQGPKFCPL